jgi:hypothetical protein
MHRSITKWLPCIICCCLIFFAATADFVSTSVITGGYNANHPPVKIEHKCVSQSAKAVGLLKNDVSNSTVALTAPNQKAFGHSLPIQILDGGLKAGLHTPATKHEFSPLLC